MKFICLQHAWFDNAGYLEEWAKQWDIPLEYIDAKKPDDYPVLDQDDVLVILGGPMSVKDIENIDWLQDELFFIKKVISNKQKMIGICLGSQLIAHAHGQSITTLEKHEIGWAPLDWSEQFLEDFGVDQISCPMFHWHSDIYDLPEGMKRIGSSTLTPVQGFYNDHILAFQFHPEMTIDGIQLFIDHDGEDIPNRHKNIDLEAPKLDPDYVEQSHQRFQPILERFFGIRSE
ncbi:type 1 glutamine amidotransferase [Jeotgalibacillus soli]|uniref:Glutamine amidotransferase domain-containing protein n=1 Tax=Jeotgalibacillus soli TaxID=889306 RepID=A0A0C2W644_9BACL|nr:hypothetical protein [Jeotgalibacillus soli]KIL52031.1 hypothetical protein KP78_04010 [Jeotgalibacillus soli]